MATPYKKWFGLKPDISDFHIFSSHIYVQCEKEPGKPNPQAQEGCWIGLESESNRHYIYWPQQHTATTERNIVFSDRQIQLIEGEDGNLGNLETSITELEQPVIPVPEEIAEPLPPEVLTGKQVR